MPGYQRRDADFRVRSLCRFFACAEPKVQQELSRGYDPPGAPNDQRRSPRSQVSLAPKAVSDGGETNEEKISKQADLLAEQVPAQFKIKVRRVLTPFWSLLKLERH